MCKYLYNSLISRLDLPMHIPCSTAGPHALNVSLHNIRSLYISVLVTAHVHNVKHDMFLLKLTNVKTL
jgi:hypothetical protein